MRKLFFLITTMLFSISAFTQDCGGISCIANPNIIQEDIIICYQSVPDSNSWCPAPPTNTCYQVCENSYNTYSTAYNVGSNYIWLVTGGQIVTTNNIGNIISVLWGPQGSGTVSVEETDSIGCTQTASTCVDVITKPIASISTIPNSTTICQNTNIQFLGENLNATTLSSSLNDSCTQQQPNWDSAGTYTYDLVYFWDFGDGNSSIDQNPYHTYNTPGTYLVSLIIANACQCADTVTTTIQVINTLGPEITTACIGTICEGDIVEYCTNAVLPNWTIEGGVLYNSLNTDNCINVIWDNYDNELNDGLGSLLLADLSSSCGSSESIMNISAVPTNPFITGEVNPCDMTTQKYSFACIPGVDYDWQIIGAPWGVSIVDGWGTSEIIIENQWVWGASYQIELSITSSTLECSFNTITLNIDILPTLDLYGNTAVCENSVTTYSTSSGNSEEWEVLNGTIQSPSGPPYIASQIDVIWDQGYGAGVVKVSPTNTGVYCNGIATQSVNIIETPQQPIDIVNDVLGDTLVCPGETYLYTIDPINTTSTVNTTYSWTITGGIPATNNGDNCVITWNPTGPYSIDVVNSTNGWPTCQSSSFLKTINSLSLASPNVNGNSTVCTNDRSNFEITNVYPNNANITWEVMDDNLGSVVSGQGTNNAIIEWGDQLGSTDIIVTVEICGDTVINTFPVTLIGTSVSFTIPNNIVCPQSSVTFTASSLIGDFTWNFGDGNTTMVTNSATVGHIYSTAGEYNVVLTLVDGNQCTSVASNLIEISGPVGNINPNPNSGIIEYCDGHTISEVLSVTTSSNANPASWEWYHNGSLVQSGGNTYPITLSPPTYTSSGIYNVVLTDVNGCSNSTNNLNLNIVTCPVNSCTGGSCGTCPNTLIPHTFACNSNIGTWDVNFSSTNGNPAIFTISGVIFASNTINASYTFTEAGTYTIACYNLSGSRIGLQEITIPFVVDWKSFAYCDAANNNQITMHFRDTSSYLLGISGISYHWDFGDGNSSTLQNPSHTYTVPGIYTVNFTVSYGGLTCNKTQQVEAEFNALFVFSGPECEQTPTISFLSSNTQILSWQWDFDDGATSARETPDRTYSQSGLYNPSLSATSIDGCVDYITIPLVIYPKPIINSLSSVNSLCVNDPQVDLSTLVSFSMLNGETQIWSGVGVVYNSGTYYFDPLLAGGGTYEVCVTITNNYNCTETQCINIMVICPEKPRIFGESDYCYDPNNWNGQNLETQSYSNGFTDYTWYIDNILDQGPSNWGSSAWFNETVGNYDITVSFVDNNGCTGTSEVFILKVHPTPNPVWVNSTGICPGTQITLTHNGGQSNVDYYWNTIPQQTGSPVDVIAEDNYQYQVIGVNEFGCESTSWNYVDIPNNVNMCNILSGCFCDSSIINSNNEIEVSGPVWGGGWSTYEWLNNGSSFVPAQTWGPLMIDPLDPNYLNLINGNITLSVTDSYGCSYESNDLIIEPNCDPCFSSQLVSTTTLTECDEYTWNGTTYTSSGAYTYVTTNSNGCDSTAILNLTINNSVTTNNPQSICSGGSYTINGNTYTSTGTYTDIFTTVNACDSIIHTDLTVYPILSSNQYFDICDGDSVVIGLNIYDSTGVYIDTLSSVNNCDSLLYTHVNVSVSDPQILLIGNSLQLSVSGGTPPYTIEVGNQNGVIVTASLSSSSLSYSYNPIINGSYYFIVIDDVGCISDTIFYSVDIFQTLIEEFAISSLNIYPNPSRDVFNVSFTSDNKQSIEVRLVNLVGEIIFTENLVDFEGEYSHSFNLSEYSKGIYLLELDTDTGIVNKKLILQ